MNEVEFGYRVRQALNAGIERMDYRTTFRLEKARRTALEKHRAAAAAPAWVAPPSVATAGGPNLNLEEDGSSFWRWAQRAGLAAPVVALLIGFVGIYEWQRARTIDELAAIDFALLLDEAPVQAYADKGFGVLLGSGSNR